jgi:hypothetical protein
MEESSVIRPIICFAALAVVRDAETNAISAFNILEALGTVGFPLFLQNASFFVLWERDPADPVRTEATFTVGVEGHAALTTQQIVLDFGEGRRHRSVVNLNGLIVPTPGSVRFRIAPREGTAAEYAFDVTAAPPAVQLAGQARVPPGR